MSESARCACSSHCMARSSPALSRLSTSRHRRRADALRLRARAASSGACACAVVRSDFQCERRRYLPDAHLYSSGTTRELVPAHVQQHRYVKTSTATDGGDVGERLMQAAEAVVPVCDGGSICVVWMCHHVALWARCTLAISLLCRRWTRATTMTGTRTTTIDDDWTCNQGVHARRARAPFVVVVPAPLTAAPRATQARWSTRFHPASQRRIRRAWHDTTLAATPFIP